MKETWNADVSAGGRLTCSSTIICLQLKLHLQQVKKRFGSVLLCSRGTVGFKANTETLELLLF